MYGLFTQLFELAGNPGLPVPDYTTLCRRQAALPVGMGQRLREGENLFVGIDSTGLKVYGGGNGRSASMGGISACFGYTLDGFRGGLWAFG